MDRNARCTCGASGGEEGYTNVQVVYSSDRPPPHHRAFGGQYSCQGTQRKVSHRPCGLLYVPNDGYQIPSIDHILVEGIL